MVTRKRTNSGRTILIAVVLGPLCAAAADLPGRALSTPAEPVANLPIQSLQHGKVASDAAATIASRASVRQRRNSDRAPVAAIVSSEPVRRPARADLILSGNLSHSPRLYWLDNPTSTGP